MDRRRSNTEGVLGVSTKVARQPRRMSAAGVRRRHARLDVAGNSAGTGRRGRVVEQFDETTNPAEADQWMQSGSEFKSR